MAPPPESIKIQCIDNPKIFDCSECGKIFSTNDEQIIHNDKYHAKTTYRTNEPVNSNIKKIVPDQEFLTSNTSDLKAMLGAIPLEALIYEENVFEKDFMTILNCEKKEEESDAMASYNCEKCKFRASSKRCPKAHNAFVHDEKFYKCENCPMRTKTESALYYHIDIKHNDYWDVEEDKREALQNMKIPDNLKEYFPDNHVILKTNPDGLCGITCGSIHIFAQHKESKQFRRVVNKHFVSHWEHYKHKISFPYERQVGVNDKMAKFQDPMEFQNFLQTPEADYLWTDCEEIQAMCNMYQMEATVVKVPANEKNPPSINHLGPDNDIKKLGLPNTVQIKSGNVPHMFLLLRGAHYDLAVPKDTLIEKYVSQPKESQDEKHVMHFPCNFCEKSFDNDRGRKIHIGKMHKSSS